MHNNGLLSGVVWETWPQPKLSIRCVRKSTQHPHGRKTELTIIRKTANSHTWDTEFTVMESRAKEKHCRTGSIGNVPQPQADAANLNTRSMALFSPEAKICYFCSTSFLILLQAGATHTEGHAQSYMTTQPGPRNVESLSLSSARHGHNAFQLCCQSESATHLGTSFRTKGRG